VRLAFLTPLPPAPTGIADYSLEVLALLAGRHEIDVFHNQSAVDRDRIPPGVRLRPVAKFLSAQEERPYDVAIYQLGNGPAHAFLYRLLARVPGLLVLHDLVLHHSRARTFLDSPEAREYAADPAQPEARAAAERVRQRYFDELAYSYPGRASALAETQMSTVGTLLPYAYPLCRLPLEAARAVAVHNRFMAEAVAEEVPGTPVVRIPMAATASEVGAYPVAALRARYGFTVDDVVVGAFGLMTAEKQIGTVARAVARAAVAVPNLRLLLVGPVQTPVAFDDALVRLGVRKRTVVTHRVPFWTLPAHMEAADVVAHLRYPSARETSAALLRVLAQGRPTVISDLEHLDEIPQDAVLRVDVADEEGQLARALVRLARDARTRRRLGLRARRFAEEAHSAARCREGYETALAAAAAEPHPPARPWPAHWLPQ
jgi:glycosyltransferase involved in cell wall biosynthesis